MDRIPALLAKEFGTIARGEETRYVFCLFPMESNLLKLHREEPRRNDQRTLEAVQMSLIKVNGYLKDIDYDFSQVENEFNLALSHGLCMSFDPFTNQEIYQAIAAKQLQGARMKEYFATPIKCLLRIMESVKFWNETLGAKGYFTFCENTLGHHIPSDSKMEFGIEAPQVIVDRLGLDKL